MLTTERLIEVTERLIKEQTTKLFKDYSKNFESEIECRSLCKLQATDKVGKDLIKFLKANQDVVIDKDFVKYIIKTFRDEKYFDYYNNKENIIYVLPLIKKLCDNSIAMIYCEISRGNKYETIYPLNKKGNDYNYKAKPTIIYHKDAYKAKLKLNGYDIKHLDVLDSLCDM